MTAIKVYNMAGEVTGETTLPDAVFGVKPNKSAMHEVVKNHLARLRQGTQSALTRAEVSGGGIKPYRQKGTGRARQGSTRVPQYTHGGVAFAPKPRDYGYSLNKKLRRLALRSALSEKALRESVIVVDNIELESVRTKDFARFLGAVGAGGKALVITPEVRRSVVLSARNIPKVRTTTAALLSASDIIDARTVVVDLAALPKIEEVYAR
ncbi:MAG: 50S ribosomal protein L4 [Oscillospiraceae bacterium]|jgi:large subunit ribosomal protein L4|nr:50S ribosomal protein L4 [Oscillospiraceae bacterium]